MKNFNYSAYAKMLKDWVVFSQKHLYFPDAEGLICYGAGEHGHWGVHTHQRAFSAFAVLAVAEDIDLSDIPLSREQILEQALGMLRYNLRTHLTGDYVCTSGYKWGHSWIYVLGLERMFHGVEAIEEYMTDDDKVLLRNVLISESEFLLNDYPIRAGLTENNKPESNIWNGALLYRTAIMYPDAPNRDKYIEKALKFFANGISLESDENSDEVVDGYRIGDLFVGANMFDSYACNHHGYLNFGYMYACLSLIAMLHFFLKSKNIKGHDMLYRHAYDLWKVVRSVTYDDGRLLRVGGDNRARYCYCQDYVLPSWMLIQDIFGEDCSEFFDGWLKILQKETEVNGDGSFLSNRFGYYEKQSPLYYTRLESDRANVISMALYWSRKYEFNCTKKSEMIDSWSDKYHGAAFSRTGNRYASFAWASAERPQALFLPQDDSSLAEWRHNLTSRVLGVGKKNYDEDERNKVETFQGGFLTSGTSVSVSNTFLAEGQAEDFLARKHIAFAALPDDNTALCIQYVKTINRCFYSEICGTFWNIPNDIFNKRLRKLSYENGSRVYSGGDYCKDYETVSLGHYVNVDDKVGLASKIPLTLVRRGKRQVDIVGRENSGTLYAEEICAPFITEHKWIDKNVEIIDTAFAMTLGTAEDTKKMNDTLIYPDINGFKTVGVMGKDGKFYLMVANFKEEDKVLNIKELNLGEGTDVVSKEKKETAVIKAYEALLISF